MTRRLLAILSLVSIFSAMILAALWVRSYYVRDTFARTTVSDLPDGSVRSREFNLSFAGGACRLRINDIDFTAGYIQFDPSSRPVPKPLSWRDEHYSGLGGGNFFLGREPDWRFPGIVYLTTPGGSFGVRGVEPPAKGVITISLLQVSLWIPFLLTMILPFLWLLHRALHRRPIGLCPHCNYDLRATPQQCPECGLVTGAPS